MFPRRFFPAVYFAPRMFPQSLGAVPPASMEGSIHVVKGFFQTVARRGYYVGSVSRGAYHNPVSREAN